jgi:tetratricopeptide (TPR) repeat protein
MFWWNLVRCALLAAVVSGGNESARAQDMRERDLFMQGVRLSAEDAAKLEEQVKSDPDDFDARLQLLGYTFQQRHTDADAKASHANHVAWAIKNHPDARWGSLPYMLIDQILNPEGFIAARTLWLEQAKAHAESAQVHANAATFFTFADRERAAELLQRAQALEPDSLEWSQRLGHLYAMEITRLSGDERRAQAKKALAEYVRAAELADEHEKYAMLTALAKVAFEAGEDAKAKEYAEELLAPSDDPNSAWNSGNAVHHGHLILGRLALRAGDVPTAKAELLEAGKTTGSPQLDSFGPNMMLAKELIEKGERDVVIEYFDLCRTFWKGERHEKELDAWAAIVKGGGAPQFGGNLAY